MDPYEKSKSSTVRHKKLLVLLKKIFGHDSFRPRQYEIINRIINGEDICAIQPTGLGKSLCYQLPAIYLDRPAIIISPLISLMDDQRMILEELGITSCCYNSNVMLKNKMKRDIMQAKYQFVYITPESLVSMKTFLVELEEKQGISLIAIDEAHCISSYGFDFRKAYRELTFLKEILPKIPILAVTATATTIVGKDICKVLNMKTTEPIKASFDRPNLYIEVRTKSKDISQDIIPIIHKYGDEPIIIYCISRKETVKIAEILKVHKIKCGIYHALLNVDEKLQTHHDFINNKIKVVVATIAFGMGINKSNVRSVIHYGSPKNLEGYYQEIGRAGRDGEKAYCFLFYNKRDFMIQKHFIEQINDTAYKKVQYKLLEVMERFVQTKLCRRKILLEYFDDNAVNHCDFCDNCCGNNKPMEVEIITTEQDVQAESKMLIDLIESVSDSGKNFGLNMYINVLRGSANKSINETMRKNKFYGRGKHKSASWWKELGDNLVTLGYLQMVHVRGKFMMQVVKVTKQGLTWANMAELDGLIEELTVTKMQPIRMVTAT